MLDIFIELATAAMAVGSVTAAEMSSNGLIAIDGIASGGKKFHITFRFEEGCLKDECKNP